MPVENLELNSSAGLPHVRISGPSGTYTTSATGATTAEGRTFVSGGDRELHKVALAIITPKPGAYTITRLPGSPVIAPVLEAHPMPDPHIRVRVTGTGFVRALHYSLVAARGEQVEFIERAAGVSHIIGTTSSAHGVFRFSPQLALARTRTIEAELIARGIAQPPRAVGSYVAVIPGTLGRPARVRTTHRRNVVTLTWSAVAGAESYRILVAGTDGRRDLYVEPARQRRLVIKPVFQAVRLTVSVSAVGGPFNVPGLARTVRVR
jgi:hypothetical protein